MNELHKKIHTMVSLMGFDDFKVDFDESTRKFMVLINDKIASKENLPMLVLNIERIGRLIAKRD